MSALAAVTAALAESHEKNGTRPFSMTLPSCLYRMLAREVKPLCSYASEYVSTMTIGGVTFHDADDNT